MGEGGALDVVAEEIREWVGEVDDGEVFEFPEVAEEEGEAPEGLPLLLEDNKILFG